MREAIMRVTDRLNSRRWVDIKLQFGYGLGFTELKYWWCLPGYLGVSSGYYRDQAIGNGVSFYDDDDNLIGHAYGVDVSWVGYPFDNLEGDTGDFSKYTRGGVLPHICTWKLTSV